MSIQSHYLVGLATLVLLGSESVAFTQLTDVTQTPNAANAGIQKSFMEEVSAGRGDVLSPGTSQYLIQRDPFRSIVRGRQLFQRKFRVAHGLGPRTGDGLGDIANDGSIGAGLSDSCASCHSRPLGSAGFGGNVFTRPDSRDTPHLFGLGLQEMLADEISTELRHLRTRASHVAALGGQPFVVPLRSKGVDYGSITAMPDGTFDTSQVDGIDPDLRVRPFFAEGSTISIREFVVGALNAEMGVESPDTDMLSAYNGQDVRTPSGFLLSGSRDNIEPPPVASATEDSDFDGVVNEMPMAGVDHLEFYLLNYFKPGRGRITNNVRRGEGTFEEIGCAVCHIPDMLIKSDRRVADVETEFNANDSNGVFNSLFATAVPLYTEFDDGSGLPLLRKPNRSSFLVEAIYTDFKRHDLGPNFWERNFDGTLQKEFMTEALWGVANSPPYGHDGRSGTLDEVIRRHGGDASAQAMSYANLNGGERRNLLDFLSTLVLFAPPDTASNLNPADRNHPDFPIESHGSIDLSPLFLDPTDKE
jgi:hypothetical protein